jgi:hypothetical protein
MADDEEAVEHAERNRSEAGLNQDVVRRGCDGDRRTKRFTLHGYDDLSRSEVVI